MHRGVSSHPDVILHSADCQYAIYARLGQIIELLAAPQGKIVVPAMPGIEPIGTDFLDDMVTKAMKDHPGDEVEQELAKLEERCQEL